MHYSAVIDAGGRRLRLKSLVRRLYGFRDCKVKVGREGDDDAARLGIIRRWIGPRVDLRIDANGAWRVDRCAQNRGARSPVAISCVEQPLAHEELASLAALRKQTAVPIMLDESLTSLIDAEAAVAQNSCDLFNIRLSKCGGFLASLRTGGLCPGPRRRLSAGLPPGRDRHLVRRRHGTLPRASPGIRYLEGSYDRHLFRRLVTNEDLTFGFGGRAPALAAPGLGVTIDTGRLSEFIVKQRAVLRRVKPGRGWWYSYSTAEFLPQLETSACVPAPARASTSTRPATGAGWRSAFGTGRAAAGRVVLLHGITSHGGWYYSQLPPSARWGFEVHFLDRRGSGLNAEARGDVDRIKPGSMT